MSKNKKDQEVRHLTSNEPVVFFLQVLTAGMVLFVLSFLVFTFLYRSNSNVVLNQDSAKQTSPVVSVSEVESDVNESLFIEELDGNVDSSKLENLFPSIK